MSKLTLEQLKDNLSEADKESLTGLDKIHNVDIVQSDEEDYIHNSNMAYLKNLKETDPQEYADMVSAGIIIEPDTE